MISVSCRAGIYQSCLLQFAQHFLQQLGGACSWAWPLAACIEMSFNVAMAAWVVGVIIIAVLFFIFDIFCSGFAMVRNAGCLKRRIFSLRGTAGEVFAKGLSMCYDTGC